MVIAARTTTTGQLYETLRSNVQRNPARFGDSLRYVIRADRLVMRVLRFTASSDTGAKRRLFLAVLEQAIEHRLAVYDARIALMEGTPDALVHTVIRRFQWGETLARLRTIMAIP